MSQFDGQSVIKRCDKVSLRCKRRLLRLGFIRLLILALFNFENINLL